MNQNQTRKRSSVRLLQKEDTSQNAKLSLNKSKVRKTTQSDNVEQQYKKTVTRKKRTSVEPVQDQEIQSDVEGKILVKPEVTMAPKGNISNKRITRNILQSSTSGTDDSYDGLEYKQTLNSQDLLLKYNKRLKDLKTIYNILATIPIFETLCARYEMLRNDTKAAAMSKYMRNKFQYFGIPTPQRRTSIADLWENVKSLSSRDLRTLAHQTWYSPEREFQYFTAELLQKEIFRIYDDKSLSTNDLALKTLNFVRPFIEHPSSWWDTVDSFSPNVVGPLVQKYPEPLLSEMDKWNTSSCFWLVRASILYQLSYKQETDADRLFRYCLQAAGEEEFFIRKAIGWALRQYYRTDPKAVRNFVHKHKDELSPLSIKEALKHDK